MDEAELLSKILGANFLIKIITWTIIVLVILPPLLKKIDDGWKYIGTLFKKILKMLGVQFKELEPEEIKNHQEHETIKKILEDHHREYNKRFDRHEINAAQSLKEGLEEHEKNMKGELAKEMGHVKEVVNTRIDGVQKDIRKMGKWITNVENKADNAEKEVSGVKSSVSTMQRLMGNGQR